jgi:hypothetical protein
MTTRSTGAAVLAFLVAGTSARGAFADSREREAARLFEEARVLQKQGQIEEACARFEASERLDPAVGTLLNLAECAERAGATATAWRRYQQAAALAARRADAERQALALRKRDDLEPRLSKLVVRPRRPLPPSTTVWRDSEIALDGELGTAVAVDPGEHRVTVKAPGFRPWTRSVTVAPGPGTVVVDVPPLEAQVETRLDDAARPTPPPPAPLVLAPPAPMQRTGEQPRGSGLRTAAWVLAGAGAATLAVGSFFGLRAASLWSAVDERCPGGHCPDTPTLDAVAHERNAASSDASIATAVLISGGVVIAVAAALFVVDDRSHAAHAQ